MNDEKMDEAALAMVKAFPTTGTIADLRRTLIAAYVISCRVDNIPPVAVAVFMAKDLGAIMDRECGPCTCEECIAKRASETIAESPTLNATKKEQV